MAIPHLPRFALMALLLCGGAAPVPGAELDATCGVRSNYDFTLSDDAVLFERVAAPVQSIVMSRGNLTANGKRVALGVKDRDRIAAFESTLRGLIPSVKALAQRAVDISVSAIQDEAASVAPNSAADPRLRQRLDARAKALKARIANSVTSKEWRGAPLNRFSADLLSDVLPLVGGDLARQAVDIAQRGDLAAANALSTRVIGLSSSLEARIRTRLQVLQPEVDRLCPALRRLDALESNAHIALPGGAMLNLLEIRS